MTVIPASELVAAALRDLLEQWILAEFGDGRIVVRGSAGNISTLQPEQTPALAVWAGARTFVDSSENIPNTVEHDFTIQGIARTTSADDPALPEQLLFRVVDVLDQLWITTVLGNIGVGITPKGAISMTFPGTEHGIFQISITLRYERMAQP